VCGKKERVDFISFERKGYCGPVRNVSDLKRRIFRRQRGGIGVLLINRGATLNKKNLLVMKRDREKSVE